MTTSDNKPFQGKEKRKEHRRVNVDRRQDIRFEPNKEDRRQNSGRRQDDVKRNIWKQYDT